MSETRLEFSLFDDYLKAVLAHQVAAPPDEANEEDWQRFLKDLSHHGIAPLFQYLSRQQKLELPVQVLTWLDQQRQQQIVADMVETTLLKKLLAAMAEAKLPVLILKGAALAHQYYPVAGLRPRCDADILLATERWSDFQALAAELCLQAEADIDDVMVLQLK